MCCLDVLHASATVTVHAVCAILHYQPARSAGNPFKLTPLDLMTPLHVAESSRTQSDVKKEELASVCLLSGRKGEGRKEERNKSMNGWMKSEPMMREGVSESG